MVNIYVPLICTIAALVLCDNAAVIINQKFIRKDSEVYRFTYKCIGTE